MCRHTLTLDDTVQQYLPERGVREHPEQAALCEATRKHPHDNMVWSGRVTEIAGDDDTRALQALNDKLHTDERIDMAVVPIGDGLSLARKR